MNDLIGGDCIKNYKEIWKNYLMALIITLAINALWMELELHYVGQVIHSMEDSWIGIIYMVITYMAVKYYREVNNK